MRKNSSITVKFSQNKNSQDFANTSETTLKIGSKNNLKNKRQNVPSKIKLSPCDRKKTPKQGIKGPMSCHIFHVLLHLSSTQKCG